MIEKNRIGLIGQKLLMTQMPDKKGEMVPVTAVLVEENWIMQVKSKEKDGYNSSQLAYCPCTEKNLNRPHSEKFSKYNIPFNKYLKEIRGMSGYEKGSSLNLSIFQAGQTISTSSLSKGKGFSGVIKRHNKSRGPMSHGSGYHRGVGSLSSGRDKNRVLKGKKMPGRMGHKKVTLKNVLIEKIDHENKIIFLKGSIPGPNKSWITLVKEL